MGSVMDVKGSKGFCDEVFTELSGMKKKIMELRDHSYNQAAKNEVIGIFERHLCELADEIDWKLQILSHSCPFDWKGSAEFENAVQVNAAEKLTDTEFSPGYLGG